MRNPYPNEVTQMDTLRALMTAAKAWYDSKTKLDKLVYTTTICAVLYVVQLFY